MRVFVVGASGALGTRLVPQLIDAGHQVIGTHNSPARADHVRALGAEPVALDLLDYKAVRMAILAAQPEAIVNEATALADAKFGRKPRQGRHEDQPTEDRRNRRAHRSRR
jgi:nucleoside-diphosphate-sugar epimerase